MGWDVTYALGFSETCSYVGSEVCGLVRPLAELSSKADLPTGL